MLVHLTQNNDTLENLIRKAFETETVRYDKHPSVLKSNVMTSFPKFLVISVIRVLPGNARKNNGSIKVGKDLEFEYQLYENPNADEMKITKKNSYRLLSMIDHHGSGT